VRNFHIVGAEPLLVDDPEHGAMLRRRLEQAVATVPRVSVNSSLSVYRRAKAGFATTPAEDGNSYSVVVTNFVGSATSSIASLTVSTGLQIDASPTSITAFAAKVDESSPPLIEMPS